MNYFITAIVFCTIFGKSWTAYLPRNAESPINQLQHIEEYNNHQAQQHIPLNEAPAALALRLPHQSYDKNDDVAEKDLQLLDDSYDDENGMPARTEAHRRQRRELSDWFIAPNTRWCGRGNTANGTYNHLGGASSADKCCRKHDHCQLFIAGMSNRFEFFNYRPYTLSHCNCDRRFRTCLKMANDEDAKTIGKLFFNMVQTQCFILKQENVCQQRATDGSCTREYVKQKAYLRNNKKF